MRRLLSIVGSIGFFLGIALFCRAGSDEPATIIDKAIKAHGIKPKNAKGFAYRGKNKGTVHVGGMDLDFTQDVAVQTPGMFKEVMQFSVMGKQVNVTSVFNGKEGWIKANDMDIPVDDKILDEFKAAANLMNLSQGMFFKDKSLKFSLLGEVQVNGKPAVGVKVEKKDMKDIDFYFDKGTGLIAKTQRRARDATSGQEVTEERTIKEYQNLNGRKLPKKVDVLRDGKAFLEIEVIEQQLVDRIDDSEFVKP